MRLESFLSIFLMLLFFNVSVQASQRLTGKNIEALITDNHANIEHTTPHTMIRRSGFFKVLDFIKNGNSPGTKSQKKHLIEKLRNCLNHPHLPTNLTQVDERAVDYIKNRLMEEEINLFRRFGLDINFMSTEPDAEQRVATQTKNLSRMVGKVVIIDQYGSGTLIAIPNGHGGHIWAILTCGHIIDSIPCDKDEDANDRLTFELKPGGGDVVSLRIKKIKVFKRAGQSFFITDIGSLPQNPENSVILPDHIRALPRYDARGDLALCFFDDTDMIEGLTIPDYLDAQFPVHDEPNFRVNPTSGLVDLNFTINLAGQAINYAFSFVDNDQNPLIEAINVRNKMEMFALGYAEFDEQIYPTVSGARNIDRAHIYPDLTINPIDGESTIYNFYHDIPTYSGMSGGPIFHVNRETNAVTIFGIVLGYNDEDGPDISNVAQKSRCEGTFLKQSLLQ